MKVSITIPVLNSHEIVRRQLLYFSRMGKVPNVELILVDDGSDPPLKTVVPDVPLGIALRIIETHDTRPWTCALARNVGVRAAQGELLMVTDIDHIIPKAAIEAVRDNFDGDKMNFHRQFAVLTEDGTLTQDGVVLTEYGLPAGTRLRIGPSPSNLAMRKELLLEIGGYREDVVENTYPQGEDNEFRLRWQAYQKRTGAKLCSVTPTIYLFPNGQYCGDVDYNPFGLFHSLSRKTASNPLWRRQLRRGKPR